MTAALTALPPSAPRPAPRGPAPEQGDFARVLEQQVSAADRRDAPGRRDRAGERTDASGTRDRATAPVDDRAPAAGPAGDAVDDTAAADVPTDGTATAATSATAVGPAVVPSAATALPAQLLGATEVLVAAPVATDTAASAPAGPVATQTAVATLPGAAPAALAAPPTPVVAAPAVPTAPAAAPGPTTAPELPPVLTDAEPTTPSTAPDRTAAPVATTSASTTSAAPAPTAVPVAATPVAPAATAAPTVPAPAPAPTHTSTPLPIADQLGARLTALTGPGGLSHGRHVLTVPIDPENLGPVRIVAHIGPESVRVELVGATDASREALRGALADLRRDLAASGLTVEVGADDGRPDGSQPGGRDAVPWQQAHGPAVAEPVAPVPVAPDRPPSRGIDLLA